MEIAVYRLLFGCLRAKIRGHTTCQYLVQLCEKFGKGERSLVQIRHCEGQLQRFVLNPYKSYPSKGWLDAWEQCGVIKEWMEMSPTLYMLWQVEVVLPPSSIARERGFSKQNRVKSDERSCLCLKTLYAYVHIFIITQTDGRC